MDKNWQFFLIGFMLFDTIFVCARYVRHVTVFLQEEVLHGTEFSNSIKSDRGKTEESFFINKIPVQKAEFYKELELAQLAELRKERERVERQKKGRIAFVDGAQVAIVEKLINKRLQESARVLELLQHEQLKQYYIFHKDTIESLQKLLEIKQFVANIAAGEFKELVAVCDMKSLQDMLDKIESWPDRLESFFQACIQNAIKHSDDTAMLKELLALLSQ